ncbi:MAG TPA: enoyl-CoA hydratase [Candidatus Binataceae bacterium]|nr:enoyl-CoA hydratase [Candidatus Binataceae bacterium]
MNYQTVSYEVFGPVARICHNRPEAANAENELLLDELDQALVRAGEDESIRVVILGGKGKHFSSGHDLRSFGKSPARSTAEGMWAQEEKYFFDYCMRIMYLPKATIAQVQGGAIAGGFMVANMCDLIVASEDAYFSDPVLAAFGAPAVEVLIHPWVMGDRKAREFLFTGERLSARDAMAVGMVNRVVPRERLEEETLALATKIAQIPPFGMRLMKRSLNRTREFQGLRSALSANFDTHEFSHMTTEQREFNRGTDIVDRGRKTA